MQARQFSAIGAEKAPVIPRRHVGKLTQAILRKTWAIRLRRSGFRDVETEQGMLSNWHAPTRTGVALPMGQRSLGDRDDWDDGRKGAAVSISVGEVAQYYRQMEHAAGRFSDAVDERIGRAMSDGMTVRQIKADLGVGQDRIERVKAQLEAWMAEPQEDDGG